MHAALLLATLFCGAPVLPHGHQDPAIEGQDADSGLFALAAQVLRLGERILQSRDDRQYLENLDLAVLALDLRAWIDVLGSTEDIHRTIADTPSRVEAVRALADVVGPAWEPALRAGLEEALTLVTPDLMTHPAITDGLALLSADDALSLQALLGDPERPVAARRALLEYIRGFVGAGVLAIAADRGERLPDWLSAAVIPRWRASLHRLRLVLDGHEFLDTDIPGDDPGPVARALLAYQCADGPHLASYFHRDPELARFLGEVRDQLSRCFPDASTERVSLTPTWDPDGVDMLPGLEITVLTRQDPGTARAALERFDQTWWLDHCNHPRTRIVVDTHLV